MPRTGTALGVGLALYLAWVAATYLLEGLPGTFTETGAAGSRLAYALVANLAIGMVLPLCFVRWLVRRRWARAGDFGFSGALRTAASVAAAAASGYALLAFNHPGPIHPVVMLNTFSQAWVVSVAEVVVCWGVMGSMLFVALRRRTRTGAYLVAAAAASILFGIYHFAHSPPFNQVGMALFLTGIGLVTSLWWFVSRDLYGTAVFHNFFAVTGVLAALEAGGLMPENPQVSMPLVATALVATLLLAMAGMRSLKPESS